MLQKIYSIFTSAAIQNLPSKIQKFSPSWKRPYIIVSTIVKGVLIEDGAGM